MNQSPNRLVATIFGAVYLLVGVLGLFVAGANFAGPEGGLLLGIFQVLQHLVSVNSLFQSKIHERIFLRFQKIIAFILGVTHAEFFADVFF